MITLNDFYTYRGTLIVQRDGDGGDSMQRTSMFLIGKELLNQPEQMLMGETLELLWPYDQDRPFRFPVKWNDPNDLSRDQEDPFVLANYLYGNNSTAKQLIKNRWKRFGKYSNKDWAGPIQWANDARIIFGNWAYPLLLILDIAYPVSAIIDVAKAWLKRGKDSDALDMDNAVTRLCFAAAVLPTFWIWLAHKIYHLFPYNLGGRGVIGALKWKHRETSGSNPYLALLWEDVWKLSFE